MAEISWLDEYRAAAVAATPAAYEQDVLGVRSAGVAFDAGFADAGYGATSFSGFAGAGYGDPEAGEQTWRERALCAETDPEAFFPEKGGSTREAKKVCTGCEVRAECLEYALANDERFGIWGGLSERERRRLRRRAA
ncbi:WhiB family transcriptional regulator [Modestobacter marinus]|uniref:WhiB family transcriptional regulator n=1 Tax=Modestobacter marinus TaxID=477641 RepID=UPI003F7705EB